MSSARVSSTNDGSRTPSKEEEDLLQRSTRKVKGKETATGEPRVDETVIVDAIDVEEEVNENQSYKEKLLGGGQKQDVNAKGNKDKALPLLEQPIQG